MPLVGEGIRGGVLSRILSSTVVEEKDGDGRVVEYEPKGRVACGGGKKMGRRQMQRGNGERTAKEGRGRGAGGTAPAAGWIALRMGKVSPDTGGE